MKKKLLFVINSLGLGGAEKSLTSLLNTIDFDRYDVDLQMFHVGGMFMDLLPKQVCVLPEIPFLASNHSLLKQLRYPRYFTARVKASVALRRNAPKHQIHDAQCYWKSTHQVFDMLPQHYDVAIAWGQGNPTHFVAEKVDANSKVAFINADYEAVGHDKEYDSPFYRKYDYIIAVSDKLSETMKKVFPDYQEKILTIYDICNAELVVRMADALTPFEKSKETIKIVTVGRLVKLKGYDLAVEAAKILQEKGLNFQWYFVGDGDARNELEKQIDAYGLQNQVMLTGAQANPYPYIKNADIYVQTSRFEGYCLTLAEARILNKPIVSTDFDVVHNQIRDGENGLIVEMTGAAIAEGVMRLATDKELQKRFIMELEKEKKGNTEEIEKLYALIED